MYTNEQLQTLIENYLAQTEFPAEPELLYAPIAYSLSGGGKRLRPMLVLLAHAVFADNVQQALPAAGAVEVFHNFTLLHDDIMDNAAIRRGKPSVFAKWGQNVAILSGDAMLIYAYRLDCPPTSSRRCSPRSTTWRSKYARDSSTTWISRRSRKFRSSNTCT
jgi:geranylgeranyl diphosphate synthase type II